MRTSSRKKTTVRSRKKATSSGFSRFKTFWWSLFFIITFIFSVNYYKDGLANYLGFKTGKTLKEAALAKEISDIRNHQILFKHADKVVGIDVSEYQEKINWDSISKIENEFPIDFVFVRATVGNDRVDTNFKQNWSALKKKNLIRGAYHYYRPNENSLEQATLFIKNVKLKKGDLPPVLDIEKLPKEQSLDSLKVGLKRWLKKVENHYGVRPIIYSGDSYYTDFLEEEFTEYTFWIANYNLLEEEINNNWRFWQFTERAAVKGIRGNVDVNIFNGNKTELKYLTIGN